MSRLVDEERILSSSTCDAIAARVFGMARGGGETVVSILSWWNGEQRWARNSVSLASDRRDVRITITRIADGGPGWVGTNQIDDISLEAAVRAAERNGLLETAVVRPTAIQPPMPVLARPRTMCWSDATFNVATEARAELAHAMVSAAEAKGMMSAGYMEVRAGAVARISSARVGQPAAPWDIPYLSWTQAQCSTTVRSPEGNASGWAGLSGADWTTIDAPALGARALEKCLASQNPVVLEPGRYTLILEPQAVADLFEIVVGNLDRESAEQGQGPWALTQDEVLDLWRTKLGLKVVDSRITVTHDPGDPQLGIIPTPWMEPVTWIDRGVLTSLAYARDYALAKLNQNTPHRGMIGYRMSGGETSIDEMISTTTRGLLVTRLSDVMVLDGASLLGTGLTRDGLWLIEHGKISKAVKNLRFTESPLFALNNIEQLGASVPVFRPVKDPYETGAPLTPAIVPSIKVRDFSFTSTVDAI
ncbi:MAG TPA: metallopeptidase TldD-related protein [Gemmatimonadaceae bacterium]|jgi:predicted Zn-dependent protease|nr:metallopeptidase TldD-related protein [Gemmatimonadaceae bacterium]